MNSIGEIHKFTTDIVWVATSQLIMALTPFVTLPALTKVYGTEIYGVWQQVIITINMFAPILCLRLETACVRFLSGSESKEKLSEAFGAMLCPVLLFIFLSLLISLFIKRELSILLFANTKYTHLIPLTFAWASTEALFIFSLSYLRARRKIKKISIIQSALSIFKTLFIVTLAILEYQLKSIIIFLIIGQTFFLMIISIIIIKEIGVPRLNLEGIRQYLYYSIPLIPNGALLWIVNSSDRYFIVHIINLKQAGIYSASYAFGSIISLFFFPISFVLFPTVSKLWEEGNISDVSKYFEYSMKYFLLLAIPSAAGLYVVSQSMILILTTSEFMAGSGLVLIIVLSAVLLGIFQINVFIIHIIQKTKWIAFTIFIGASINVFLNIILIPVLGIMGAAISTLISYLVLSSIILIWAKKELSYNIDFKFICKVILSSALMALCLNQVDIQSFFGILLVSILGVMIFVLSLWLLKSFSDDEKRFIRLTFSGFYSKR